MAANILEKKALAAASNAWLVIKQMDFPKIIGDIQLEMSISFNFKISNHKTWRNGVDKRRVPLEKRLRTRKCEHTGYAYRIL